MIFMPLLVGAEATAREKQYNASSKMKHGNNIDPRALGRGNTNVMTFCDDANLYHLRR